MLKDNVIKKLKETEKKYGKKVKSILNKLKVKSVDELIENIRNKENKIKKLENEMINSPYYEYFSGEKNYKEITDITKKMEIKRILEIYSGAKLWYVSYLGLVKEILNIKK